MRGIFRVAYDPDSQDGIIPAGAGHLYRNFTVTGLIGDHPRRCGAFASYEAHCKMPLGSSPQVRGISMVRSNLCLSHPDHPRRCGAFCAASMPDGSGIGSSPQVRGILTGQSLAPEVIRIIPAGAGHFFISVNIIAKVGDHPRRCGAFEVQRLPQRCVEGSSPQVRGICYSGPTYFCNGWIIPAGAGHLTSCVCGCNN